MSPEPSHPVGEPKGPKEIPGPIQPTRNRDRQARRNGRRAKRKRRKEPPEPQQIPPEEDQTETSGPDGPPGVAEAADDEHVVDYLA